MREIFAATNVKRTGKQTEWRIPAAAYDYELLALVSAYKSGALEEDGLELLDQTLAEYGMARKDIPKI